jgi:hypothetical protein
VAIDCVSRHTVTVYDRGGVNKLAEIVDIAAVSWNRVRDDISEASIVLSGAACDEQNGILTSLRSSRHEIVIHRGGERVWEGPITRMSGTRNTFSIHARDVMHYAARTTMRNAYSNAYPNVGPTITRAALIMNTELARKEALDPPINVLPFLVLHQTPTDARTSAATHKYQYQVWEHIDELAAKAGMDYTVVGRAIHFWDTHQPLGQTQTVTQADFLGDLEVTEYGMELATHAHVTDGEGNYGSAGANDPYYGEVELLTTSGDETEGETPPTSAEMQSQAQRNLAGRIPTPLVVRVPENSSLNPNGVLTMSDLVPGVWMPLRAEVIGFNISQMQKLQNMKVTEDGSGETITVTLQPASINEEEA